MKPYVRVSLVVIIVIWLIFITYHHSGGNKAKQTDFDPPNILSGLHVGLQSPNTNDETFNWKEYIELNSDLAKVIFNEKDATNHYIKFGKNEKRPIKVVPEAASWNLATSTIGKKLRSYERSNVPKVRRNLIIFHVGQANCNNSMDVFVNNMKIFVDSISKHDVKAEQQAIYLFNVVGGDDNPLLSLIPSRNNVAIVKVLSMCQV
jgi:hypothetical protein